MNTPALTELLRTPRTLHSRDVAKLFEITSVQAIMLFAELAGNDVGTYGFETVEKKADGTEVIEFYGPDRGLPEFGVSGRTVRSVLRVEHPAIIRIVPELRPESHTDMLVGAKALSQQDKIRILQDALVASADALGQAVMWLRLGTGVSPVDVNDVAKASDAARLALARVRAV